jgi:hypothetical protein
MPRLSIPGPTTTLGDLAQLIRTKNAGPSGKESDLGNAGGHTSGSAS